MDAAHRMSKKRLGCFLAVSFGITWLCWGGLAVLDIPLTHPAGVVLHLLGGFGPTFAALFWFGPVRTRKTFAAFLFRWKKGSLRYLLLFAVLEITVVGLSSLEWNRMMPPYLVPVVFLQAVVIYGGEEELGWRGVMEPELERVMPFPAAALITGLVWAVWHIPLWFVDGATQQNIPFALFAALAVLQSFWYAAVQKRMGCVFPCCILHGLTNTLLSIFVIKVNAILVIGFLLMTVISICLWKRAEGDDYGGREDHSICL